MTDLGPGRLVLIITKNSTSRFDLPQGYSIGAFRGSYDRVVHLARYRPYVDPPRKVLCEDNVGTLTSWGGPLDRPLCLRLCATCCEAARREGCEVPSLEGNEVRHG